MTRSVTADALVANPLSKIAIAARKAATVLTMGCFVERVRRAVVETIIAATLL
jgi:hypothetical protein